MLRVSPRTRKIVAAVTAAAVLALAGLTGLAAMMPARAASSDLPFTVTNSSGRPEDTFLYVMARSQTTGEQGYVDGSGDWHAFDLPASVANGTGNPTAPDVSISGPADGSSVKLSLPANLTGGRIYVAFGEHLTFQLSPGGLVEPAAWNSDDPNHDVLFDWAEFARNGTAININTTMVDMFSVPIAITVKALAPPPPPAPVDNSVPVDPSATPPDTTPFPVTRTEGTLAKDGRRKVFDAVTALGGDWAALVDVRESDGLPLRVLAPIHGIDSAAPVFDAAFFDSYVEGVYDYYASHALTVDTALGVFTGKVANGAFTFRGEGGRTIGTIGRPTTPEIFGCHGALQPTGQPDQDAILAVGARICAGFHRGTLSTPDRAGSDRQATFDATAFYRHESSDLYSKVMHDHSTNGRAYGFAFDDVAEFNPSIDEPTPTSVTMTLQPFGSSVATGPVAGAEPAPPSAPSPGGEAPVGAIQAEARTAQRGTTLSPTSDSGGGKHVGHVGDGDWLRFEDVNFGRNGLSTLRARVASGAATSVSGVVEVRLDSRTSTPIGSFAVGRTGGWQSWRTVPAAIATTTGTHDVYLTFATGSGREFVDVNWFTFA
ncbi:glycoside hydrolase family 64 protein [Cellulomonas cellasea]|uniref:Uncharacterized protein n=2 Tax=Cellulomonas cellasea TaxID=43670 RepID=A0A0A0B621_9CELL|nr:beta-1,3-glucanase family protein [Cellulomonas cellasea]KGM01638.1 hypothetical protein Q760_18185 [Cellulomonas cellasea DSM 20118]GEA87983.1 hypothetical protein CCE01nite_19320 [Cellulomonas cellasea]